MLYELFEILEEKKTLTESIGDIDTSPQSLLRDGVVNDYLIDILLKSTRSGDIYNKIKQNSNKLRFDSKRFGINDFNSFNDFIVQKIINKLTLQNLTHHNDGFIGKKFISNIVNYAPIIKSNAKTFKPVLTRQMALLNSDMRHPEVRKTIELFNRYAQENKSFSPIFKFLVSTHNRKTRSVEPPPRNNIQNQNRYR